MLFLLITSLSFKALTTYAQVRFVRMREYTIGKKLVEGLYALKGAKSLSLKYKLDTPIINAIDDFINNGLEINDIILKLLRRPIKMEF